MLQPRSSHGHELYVLMKRYDTLILFNFQIHCLSFLYIQDLLPFGSPYQLPNYNYPYFLYPPQYRIYISNYPNLIYVKAQYLNVVLSFQHYLYITRFKGYRASQFRKYVGIRYKLIDKVIYSLEENLSQFQIVDRGQVYDIKGIGIQGKRGI